MKNATSRGLNHFLPRFREERDSGNTLSMTLENDDDEPPRSRAVAEEEDESIVLFFSVSPGSRIEKGEKRFDRFRVSGPELTAL